MAATKKRARRTFQRPAVLTDRIEVRCSPEEKDLIYAAALTAGKPVTRFLVEAALFQIAHEKAQPKNG